MGDYHTLFFAIHPPPHLLNLSFVEGGILCLESSGLLGTLAFVLEVLFLCPFCCTGILTLCIENVGICEASFKHTATTFSFSSPFFVVTSGLAVVEVQKERLF